MTVIRFIQLMLLVSIAAFLPACSKKGFYEGFQAGYEYQCYSLPPAQQEACLTKKAGSYEEYTRERDEQIKLKH
jgi:hypothetical protein